MRKPSQYIRRLMCLILALAGLIGATTLALEPAGRAFWEVAGHASMAAAQSAGAVSVTGNMKTARLNHTATLLANGKVLVSVGIDVRPLISAELYDPATGTWSSTGNLNIARRYHTATLLPNGKVLVARKRGRLRRRDGKWQIVSDQVTPVAR